MRRTWSRITLCTMAMLLASSTGQALAAPPIKPSGPDDVQTAKPAAPPVEPPVVAADKRQELLGQGWQVSGDRLWTTSGDATGFHVMVAEAKTGYSWRTVATLGHPGVETDKWIGNACVTGSGAKAVVVYAPRTFTNKEQLFDRGGFTAVVDLGSGVVTKLPVHTSLAYFNPGCGVGETVALTQGGDGDLGKTALMTVDAGTGALSKRTELEGQLTSAVPIGDDFAVAGRTGVLKVSRDGKKERLSKTELTPSHLKPDAEGGVVYLASEGDKVSVQRATSVGSPATTLATGESGKLGVTAGTAGKVFITGAAGKIESLPQSVKKIDVPVGTAVSTNGEAALTEIRPSGSPMKAEPQAWHLKAKSLKTGRDLGFTVNGADTLTPREVDPGYTCAVPRNDTNVQVKQPKPKQIEWAVNMAVRGFLMIDRPADWQGNGLTSSYKPQGAGMFPYVSLKNGGHVPSQVMLGIIGQESNMWQAARYVLPGETGNPLIGNYYGFELYDGTPLNDWDVDFSNADCGYGVTQMTDGMRKHGSERPGEEPLTRNQQVAVATDYSVNVAAGLQLLSKKWNELQDAGVKLHDNDATTVENWFLTVWAYNSGYHQPGKDGANGAYGLGWGNNPANPRYDPNRGSFGERPIDFARPQYWPYPEKVMGFAANPPWGFEDENTEVPFFNAASWIGGDGSPDTPGTGPNNRRLVKPDRFKFCDSNNNCEPGASHTPTAPEVDDDPVNDTGPCAHKNTAGQYDLKCWWHTSTGWKADNCRSSCGNESTRYDYPQYWYEPTWGNSFPATCDYKGLPSTRSLVIENRVASFRGCAAGRSSGTLTLRTDGKPAAYADLHQIGSGLGGHYWLTHTRAADSLDAKASVTAEWQLGEKLRTKAQVFAFIPAHGLRKATRAVYKIETARGVQEVEADQTPWKNQWLPLGTFDFNNNPKISLSSIAPNGQLGENLVFDAVAFSPVTQHQGGPDVQERMTRIINHKTGKCLAPAETWTVPTPVVQVPCLNTDINFSDDWMVRHGEQIEEPAPGGGSPSPVYTYIYVHRATGNCLAIKNNSDEEGAAAELRPCGDTSRFRKSGNPNLVIGPGQQVALSNIRGFKYLHPADNSFGDDVPVVQDLLRVDTDPETVDPFDPFMEWDI